MLAFCEYSHSPTAASHFVAMPIAVEIDLMRLHSKRQMSPSKRQPDPGVPVVWVGVCRQPAGT